MSKYTISIKNLIKNNFDFGLKDYPIFDETYRDTLNTKILNHYFLDEIGLETPELFKHFLNNTMNEIMPYYNELYKAQKQAIDNLYNNVNINETYERTANENSDNTTNTTASTNSTNKSKNVNQNTPQGKILQETIDNFTYASEISMNKNENDITDNSNSTSNLKNNSTENYLKKIVGNQGLSTSDILEKFKNNFTNIDLQIIYDLSDLFIGLL